MIYLDHILRYGRGKADSEKAPSVTAPPPVTTCSGKFPTVSSCSELIESKINIYNLIVDKMSRKNVYKIKIV